MENWRKVIEYEDLYEVSNMGRVRSVKKETLILKPFHWQKDGYMYARLSKKSKKCRRGIHVLVAKAFIPNPKNKKQVNHIDGDKTNNTVDNLEWSTPRENSTHYTSQLNTSSKFTGVSLTQSGKWASPIRIKGKKYHLGTFDNEFEAHIAYQNKLKEVT